MWLWAFSIICDLNFFTTRSFLRSLNGIYQPFTGDSRDVILDIVIIIFRLRVCSQWWVQGFLNISSITQPLLHWHWANPKTYRNLPAVVDWVRTPHAVRSLCLLPFVTACLTAAHGVLLWLLCYQGTKQSIFRYCICDGRAKGTRRHKESKRTTRKVLNWLILHFAWNSVVFAGIDQGWLRRTDARFVNR